MRRIELHLEARMDDELATQATRHGISKAELIRRLLGDALGRLTADPIDALIGTGDGDEATHIDEGLYGR